MKTRLSQFCGELNAAIEPLISPLAQAVQTVGDGSSAKPLFEGLPQLHDVHHKLSQLVEKVGRQQAYVLIFGPLKSGKSTLMNAITGAYVSEVTSLPAYPCLVYVSHAEQTQFTVTRYNGTTEQLTNANDLRKTIDLAHHDLAREIRAVEDSKAPPQPPAAGPAETTKAQDKQRFEPSVHFPQALRKIDVRVPAGELASSGAVLVDTPGLYTRMKFGYGQMTRDFRDTAACAVFVVKSENLFLEQVFQEFHELLELFGRIFLVVNLDSTKRDLQPDGSLKPSLERENPQSIIEAFESLAMSTKLKAAADSGRLRIYPVDVLNAASRRLKLAQSTDSPIPAKNPILSNNSATATDTKVPQTQTGFESFRRDMNEYLNSTEYFQTFVTDSLRYANAIGEQLQSIAKNSTLSLLRQNIRDLEQQARSMTIIVGAFSRLQSLNSLALLNSCGQAVIEESKQAAKALLEEARLRIRGAVDQWFDEDSSLDSLISGPIATSFCELEQRSLEQIRRSLVQHMTSAQNSASLAANEIHQADFQEASLNLTQLIQIALDHTPLPQVKVRPLCVALQEIPLKRSVMDWMLFRSKQAVQHKVFGPETAPTQVLNSSKKHRLLGALGREELNTQIREHLAITERRLKAAIEEGWQNYITAFEKQFRSWLNEESTSRKKQLSQLQSRLSDLMGIDQSFILLMATQERTAKQVKIMQQQYSALHSQKQPPANRAEPTAG